MVSLIPALETILLSPLWGGLLDARGNGRQIILLSALAQGLGFTLFPFLSSPEQFVIVVSLTGIFTSSFVPIFSALATLSSQQYGRAIGGFWAVASLGFGSATLAGGVLYEFLGVRELFVLGAVYGYVSCIVTVLVSGEGFSSTRSSLGFRGYRRLLTQRNIISICTISLVVMVSASAFNSFFTIYLVDFLGGSRLMAGLAATGTTLLGALAFRFVGPLNDRVGRKRVFLLGTLGYVAYFVATGLIGNVVIVAFLWVLPVYPLVGSSAAALVSDYTSASDRGKGLGLLGSAVSLGGGLGPLMGGLIADAYDLRTVIVFSLAGALVSVVASQLFLKDEFSRRAQIAPGP